MKLLITGASGNLGSRLVKHLLQGQHELRLLLHKSSLPCEISGHSQVSVRQADLACYETLVEPCEEIDCVIHLAGLLFAPLPERFLPRTNVGYVENLVKAAEKAGVRKFILISFPHVEGETTPEHPAVGRLDASPTVIHFRTRLEAENLVLAACRGTRMTPVVLRAGVVYGSGIKLIDGARWMLRHRLMAVWRKPTWIHLIALPDFLCAVEAAIEKENASGVYQICDDAPLTLQDFLDQLANHYGYPCPRRLPAWMFHLAGISCELFALLFGAAAPLNRDIVRAGMTSSVADTSRMKSELLPRLAYPTFREGIRSL